MLSVIVVILMSTISTTLQFQFPIRAFADGIDSGQEQQTDGIQDGTVIMPRSNPFDDLATGYENNFLIINVLYNDRKEIFGLDDQITISSLTNPSFGAVTLNSDNTVTYIPYEQRLPAGGILSDSFEYFAIAHNRSGSELSYNATVWLHIIQTNDVPLAIGSNYTVFVNGTFSSQMRGYDQDGDNLIYSFVSKPRLGEIEYFDPNTGNFLYSPHGDSEGEDAFTYAVSDGISTSGFATIRIVVSESIDESGIMDESGGDESTFVNDNFIDEESSGVEDETGIADSAPTANVTENSKPYAISNLLTNEVIAGDTVYINGFGSYDPDGDQITYSWSQIIGSKVSLSDANSAVTSFVAPSVSSSTIITLRLIVSDGQDVSEPSFASLTVSPLPTLRIDILPAIYPNEINTNKDNETISVAILGSDSVSVSDIVQDDITFGPNSAVSRYFEEKDSDGDGFVDLIGYFTIGDLGLKSSDTDVCLSASLFINSGVHSATACDSVRIVNQNTS